MNKPIIATTPTTTPAIHAFDELFPGSGSGVGVGVPVFDGVEDGVVLVELELELSAVQRELLLANSCIGVYSSHFCVTYSS